MKKYYYGAWQNFYNLNWPVRFFIELVFLSAAIFLICKALKKVGSRFGLKQYLVKGWVWIVTELIYLIGRDRAWAVELDNRMIEWGNRAAEHTGAKRRTRRKWFLGVGAVVIYLLATFVDLPFAKHLQAYYLSELGHVKSFFQRYEQTLSRGYEKYPPLFVKSEPVEETEEETEEQTEEAVLIYIQLNEKGQSGANIRQEPSLNGAVVGGVDGQSEIRYQNQWEHDGERYWIKIYIPGDDIEGWLSGNLIDSIQLEEIVNEEL